MTPRPPTGAPPRSAPLPAVPGPQDSPVAPPPASATGLTGVEAARRLARGGPNEPVATRQRPLIVQMAGAFINPLSVILLAAAGVSAFVGETLNAGIIVAMVVLGFAVNFVQTYRSQQSADRLRAAVAPTATVQRDGQWGELPRAQVVLGDLIRLGAGDLVPADARLVEAQDLHVQQAALTGESLPVAKEATGGTDGSPDSAALNMVFLGTSVVSGTATARVTATGGATTFGDIATRLATKAPETAFERGMGQFARLILWTVMALVLFIFLVSAAFHRPALESLLFAVALAVGLTPEFLPMITAVTLTQGAVHMARRQVIVKNLAAIQNLGSIDVLCSDKTGTLTSGSMDLAAHLDPQGGVSERALLLAYLNSLYTTGVPNPVDTAILARANANPLDMAILRHDHPDVHSYRKIAEIPFDFERRRAAVVVGLGDGTRLLIAKGAPESILTCCTAYEQAGQSHPFDPAAQAGCQQVYEELSAQGYRVLAVASCPVPDQPRYHPADEAGLTLDGFLTFADPLLPDAAASLAALRADGVQVKILTGDNERVAEHICQEAGLDVGRPVLGDDLDRMTDPALAAVAEQTTLFARVSPAQKNRIILALKARSHVVGYMGDGINDAPSLHAADVGISVASGVDVAKDAADIILLEPGLAVLHNGILEGRKAFGNVMKYLLMGTSSNFGNMFSMAAAFLFLPFLPMLPTQILLNNFLYDLAQVTIPTDHVDPSFMRQPRQWDIRLIRDFMVVIGPISSLYDFLTFFVLLTVFQAGGALFHTGWFVESLATQTLVLFVIRTAGPPWRSRPSRPLVVTTLLVVALGLILPFTPLAGPLGFVPLPLGFFLFLAGATVTYLLLVEVIKERLMQRRG